jgi:hypothetical protein
MSSSRRAVSIILLLPFAVEVAGSAVLRGQSKADPVRPVPV